ncbi:MAG: class I SAM-dependent methyltransferase [Alphaproteobacteria bacterium]|nr:class I SAM-dependent methyltransferase [Alphaproteobacteria bacterium]
MTYPWLSIFKLDTACSAYRENDYKKLSASLKNPENKEFLNDPFLIAGLRCLIVPDPDFENFVIHLRRAFLEKVLPPEKYEALLCAAAIYCHYTTYIMAMAAGEQKEIDALQKHIEANNASPEEIMLFACYRSLSELENAAAVAEAYRDNPKLSDIIRIQIDEPALEKEIAAALPALTGIKNEISKKVQEQYEEFPYPHWKGFPAGGLPDMLADCRDVLIAGCGTGQEAVYFARAMPQALILAVDLSRASLAYAIRKAEEFGIENIYFRQGDILEIGNTGKKFDLVVTSGVLHHMQDPVKGWRCLAGSVKPGGWMRVALYSRLARRNITTARAAIAERGYPPTQEGIRRFRRECREFLTQEQINTFVPSPDFYSFPACRDLLFHAQEHCFDVPEIERAMKETGLDLVAMDVPLMYADAYRQMFPDDAVMKNFAHIEAFERKFPDTFQAMYAFWYEKNL